MEAPFIITWQTVSDPTWVCLQKNTLSIGLNGVCREEYRVGGCHDSLLTPAVGCREEYRVGGCHDLLLTPAVG